MNAVVKNKQMAKAREERLGKAKKRKTRTEILAAMDLQVAMRPNRILEFAARPAGSGALHVSVISARVFKKSKRKEWRKISACVRDAAY